MRTLGEELEATKALLIHACIEIDRRPSIWNRIPEVAGWWVNYQASTVGIKQAIIAHKKRKLQEACDQVTILQDEIETLENGC